MEEHQIFRVLASKSSVKVSRSNRDAACLMIEMKRRFSFKRRPVHLTRYLNSENRGLGVLGFCSRVPTCQKEARVRSQLRTICQQQMHNSSHLRQTAPCILIHVSHPLITTRRMDRSAHMHVFFYHAYSGPESVSRLRYIIFAFAAEAKLSSCRSSNRTLIPAHRLPICAETTFVMLLPLRERSTFTKISSRTRH